MRIPVEPEQESSELDSSLNIPHPQGPLVRAAPVPARPLDRLSHGLARSTAVPGAGRLLPDPPPTRASGGHEPPGRYAMSKLRPPIIAILAPLLAGIASAQVSMTFTAARDGTLYENASGALANGAGTLLFSGLNSNSVARRGI